MPPVRVQLQPQLRQPGQVGPEAGQRDHLVDILNARAAVRDERVARRRRARRPGAETGDDATWPASSRNWALIRGPRGRGVGRRPRRRRRCRPIRAQQPGDPRSGVAPPVRSARSARSAPSARCRPRRRAGRRSAPPSARVQVGHPVGDPVGRRSLADSGRPSPPSGFGDLQVPDASITARAMIRSSALSACGRARSVARCRARRRPAGPGRGERLPRRGRRTGPGHPAQRRAAPDRRRSTRLRWGTRLPSGGPPRGASSFSAAGSISSAQRENSRTWPTRPPRHRPGHPLRAPAAPVHIPAGAPRRPDRRVQRPPRRRVAQSRSLLRRWFSVVSTPGQNRSRSATGLCRCRRAGGRRNHGRRLRGHPSGGSHQPGRPCPGSGRRRRPCFADEPTTIGLPPCVHHPRVRQGGMELGDVHVSPVVVGRSQQQPPGVGSVARMIAPCMPSATWWVAVTETSVRPAASRPSVYSANVRAPATQPT